ncbi:MAG TPA: ATP-dependent Clp protease ATP-binding subunit, partial [Flavobacteriales bacterium]|nr:ATP-dependent Clp protease ATP-binding subunit [Flavobacteriales bacterium]
FARVHDLGYKIELTPEAKDFVADKGFDEKFGARPLKRAIQKMLEDPIAEEIIKSSLAEGDAIHVAMNKDKTDIELSVVKAGSKAKSSKKKEENTGE